MLTACLNFKTTNWITIPGTKHQGEIGASLWQTLEFQGIRMRIVEFSHNFIDDYWFEKGHIVFCLEGEFTCEIQTGEKQYLDKNMSFIISDRFRLHRISSEKGAKLLIIDGDFISARANSAISKKACKKYEQL